MFCSNCGKKLADESKFCPACGTKVGETSEKQPETPNSVPIAAQNYFNQAKEYEANQDYDNAYDAYKAAVQIAPAFFEAQKKLAQVCIILEDVKQAGRILNDVISKNPNDYEAFYLRGKAYSLLGKDEKALMDYDIALKTNNKYIDLYKEIISVYKLRNDWDQTIKTANEAIKVAPGEFFFYASRGEAYYRKNLITEALSDFNKALKINHDGIETVYLRGIILFGKEENDKALEDINHALKLSPDNIDFLFLRGKIYFSKGEFEKAISDFDLVEKHYGEETTPELYKFRAIARYKMGYYKIHDDKIMEDYSKLCKLISSDELDFFKDVMVERYRKAIVRYKGKRQSYLVAEHSYGLLGTSEWNNYLIIGSADDPHGIRKSNNGAIAFLNHELASEYKQLVTNHVGRMVRGTHTSRFRIESNIKKGTLKCWFIIHAESGYLYYKNGTGKNKSTWGFFSDDSGYKYESLDNAFKDYEKIIHSENLCNKNISNEGKIVSEVFTWLGSDNKWYSSNDFMNIFIVGLGGTEEIDENSAQAFVIKGGSYSEKKDYKQAIAEYTAAIKIDPSYFDAYESRAHAYWSLNDYDKAIADYTTAINIGSDDHSSFYYRGLIYEGKKDYDHAIADFKKAIEIDPDYSKHIYDNIYKIYKNRGEDYLKKVILKMRLRTSLMLLQL